MKQRYTSRNREVEERSCLEEGQKYLIIVIVVFSKLQVGLEITETMNNVDGLVLSDIGKIMSEIKIKIR